MTTERADPFAPIEAVLAAATEPMAPPANVILVDRLMRATYPEALAVVRAVDDEHDCPTREWDDRNAAGLPANNKRPECRTCAALAAYLAKAQEYVP